MASLGTESKASDASEQKDTEMEETTEHEEVKVKTRNSGGTARRGRGKRVTRSCLKVEDEVDPVSGGDQLVKEVETEPKVEVEEEAADIVTEDNSETIVNEDNIKTIVNEDNSETIVNEDNIKTIVNEDNSETIVNEDNSETIVNEDNIKTIVNEDNSETIVKEVNNENETNTEDNATAQMNGMTEQPKEKQSMSINESEVPELDAPPPPTITKTAPMNVKIRTTSQASEIEPVEEMETNPPDEKTVEESGNDSDVQEVPAINEVKEIEQIDLVDDFKPSSDVEPHVESLEGMTVIDEISDESEALKKDDDKKDEDSIVLDPDTEMVSEDELPAEVSKEQLDTEAVSDEELPTSADLPETEAVSEDELPPEGTEKKKKKKKVSASPKDSKGAAAKDESRTEGEEPKTKAVKRKLPDGEYDPSSPTSEASNDESPQAKKSAVDGKTAAKTTEKVNKMLPELEKYWKAVRDDPADFTGWTYLLQYVDQENDVDAAREAYDAFLSHYPYCYGYWRKYADYEKRKGNVKKCEEVFERGLKAIPLSVDLWIHYINYCKATYQKDEDFLRGIFEKALDACGLEFRSDRLWESYIKWETEGKRFNNVTALYDKLLKTPTQGYPTHFENFQEHINNTPPNKSLSVDEFLTLRQEVVQVLKQYDTPLTDSTPPGDEDAPPGEEPPEASTVGSVEEITALRERIVAIRRKVHKATDAAVTARWNFEEGIKRPYFHVKPLERCQLKNWMEYLDYEIEQGDHQRIIVLFERCLIACALYEEFWIRYLRYLEDKCSDMVDKIRDVYERACTIHHTKKPNLHLHWAVYEESHGNYTKAADILSNLEKVVPNLMQVTYRRINLARRSGDLDGATQLYEHYIGLAKNRIFANNMSIKYARFCWKVLDDVDKAVTVLKKAVEKDKENPRLYLQMIDMALQKSPLQEADVVAIIDQFLGRETAELEQKVLFAQRKIEFLEDFGSDVKNVQKATDEFQRLLKQLNDRKKKSPDMEKIKSDEGPPSKKAKSGTSDTKQTTATHSGDAGHTGQSPQPSQATTTTSTYPATNYNQAGGYSQPPAQGNYQGGQYPQQTYNQPPYNQQYNQSDPNYNNYQNWGYSQAGYGNYNQGWTGYGNYY